MCGLTTSCRRLGGLRCPYGRGVAIKWEGVPARRALVGSMRQDRTWDSGLPFARLRPTSWVVFPEEEGVALDRSSRFVQGKRENPR